MFKFFRKKNEYVSIKLDESNDYIPPQDVPFNSPKKAESYLLFHRKGWIRYSSVCDVKFYIHKDELEGEIPGMALCDTGCCDGEEQVKGYIEGYAQARDDFYQKAESIIGSYSQP